VANTLNLFRGGDVGFIDWLAFCYDAISPKYETNRDYDETVLACEWISRRSEFRVQRQCSRLETPLKECPYGDRVEAPISSRTYDIDALYKPI
jgi:hypothetical protein